MVDHRTSAHQRGLSLVPPAGFEPTHMAPEANALSPELRGLIRANPRAAHHRDLWRQTAPFLSGHESAPNSQTVTKPASNVQAVELVRHATNAATPAAGYQMFQSRNWPPSKKSV
jgi:hypothetical protein